MSNHLPSATATTQPCPPLSVALKATFEPLSRPADAELIGDMVLLVEEAIHRIATMDEAELRNFLPWLLHNDGELASLGSGDLAMLQAFVLRAIPPRNWPRP